MSAACSPAEGSPADAEGGAGGSQAGQASGGTSAGAGGAAGKGASGGSSPSGGVSQAGSAPDGGTAGTAGTAGSGDGGGGSEDGPSEHGFTLRKPGKSDLDWLCTFRGGSEPGYAYVRLLQTGTKQTGLSETPVYEAKLAQVSVKGAVSDVMNARYDYGGGHHNDSLSFDYEGKTHSYYHSSFGFGFRSCQPMDCRNVYEPGSTEPSTEGCGPDRSLPEVCVSIEADGSHAELTDSFMKCAGDQT